MLGAGIRRRMMVIIGRYKTGVLAQFDALMAWYRGLDWQVQVVATLIVLFGTLGLSVASLGLWLVLFSVQLPFWLIAIFSTTARSIAQSMGKYAFKTVMFLQMAGSGKF